MNSSINRKLAKLQRLSDSASADLINAYINNPTFLPNTSKRLGLALLYISGALVLLGAIIDKNQFQILERVTLGIFIVSGVCLICAVWLYNALKNKKVVVSELDITELFWLKLWIIAGYFVSVIAYWGLASATVMLIALIWMAG